MQNTQFQQRRVSFSGAKQDDHSDSRNGKLSSRRRSSKKSKKSRDGSNNSGKKKSILQNKNKGKIIQQPTSTGMTISSCNEPILINSDNSQFMNIMEVAGTDRFTSQKLNQQIQAQNENKVNQLQQKLGAMEQVIRNNHVGSQRQQFGMYTNPSLNQFIINNSSS